eukprot:m.33515 g.33515  ORF g.33515 m.33515 type:complete len:53 (+) comp9635_c0_seq1:192-350(+)
MDLALDMGVFSVDLCTHSLTHCNSDLCTLRDAVSCDVPDQESANTAQDKTHT